MNIAIISGSSRPERKSHQVVKEIERKLNEEFDNYKVWIMDVLELNLPLLDNPLSANKAPSDIIVNTAERLVNSDAFIIVSPEFNGTFPGALKNTMDYFLKQYEKKVFGIVGVSAGMLGGINAAKNLQTYAQHIKGIVSPYLLITPNIDKVFQDGKLMDANYGRRLDNFLKEFLWLAHAITNARNS